MKRITYQPKQVRIFLALLLVLAFLVTLRLSRHGDVQARWLTLAAEAAVIGVLLAFPRIFFPVFKLIMIATSHLGTLIFAVLAVLVFFLILTPIALVMRLFGKSFMNSRPDPSLPSYFCEAEEPHDIEKQF